VSLAAGNGVEGGTAVVCKRIDASAHTVSINVSGNGGTIDGNATALNLPVQYNWLQLVADGSAKPGLSRGLAKGSMAMSGSARVVPTCQPV
jgi:hypothetical protein